MKIRRLEIGASVLIEGSGLLRVSAAREPYGMRESVFGVFIRHASWLELRRMGERRNLGNCNHIQRPEGYRPRHRWASRRSRRQRGRLSLISRKPSHGGFIGVDIFFVISGLPDHLDPGRADRAWRHCLRRFLRPSRAPHFPRPGGRTHGVRRDWRDSARSARNTRALGLHIVAGAGFLSNLLLWSESGYFDDAAEFKPLLHLWSLAIEEQFYIL